MHGRGVRAVIININKGVNMTNNISNPPVLVPTPAMLQKEKREQKKVFFKLRLNQLT